MKKNILIFAVIIGVAFAASAAEKPLLKSGLSSEHKDEVLFTDINSDGKPSTLLFNKAAAQEFIHPGIDMTSADLEYMKKQVLAGGYCGTKEN